VGSIFSRSWGYDQTQVDWYQVINVSPSGKTLKLIKIAGKRTEDGGHVVPVPDAWLTDWCARCDNHRKFHENGSITSHAFTEVFTKRVRLGCRNEYDAYINWDSFSGASLWDGKPEYATPYGGGH
jgi:hypothetical protein